MKIDSNCSHCDNKTARVYYRVGNHFYVLKNFFYCIFCECLLKNELNYVDEDNSMPKCVVCKIPVAEGYALCELCSIKYRKEREDKLKKLKQEVKK